MIKACSLASLFSLCVFWIELYEVHGERGEKREKKKKKKNKGPPKPLGQNKTNIREHISEMKSIWAAVEKGIERHDTISDRSPIHRLTSSERMVETRCPISR